MHRGVYVMSGNNCHVTAEEVIISLCIRESGVNMNYGDYLGVGEFMFNAKEDFMPLFPL